MDRARQQLRLQQLDRLLGGLGRALPPAPPAGWIKTLREAHGLSLDEFARRLGFASRTTAHQLERAEVDGSITIRRLRAAADALGCDLAIVPIPRQPLFESVHAAEEADEVATYRRIGHSMALEGQAVAEDRLLEIGRLARIRGSSKRK
jgi:predicted DNA-binding mobile mystery protein A